MHSMLVSYKQRSSSLTEPCYTPWSYLVEDAHSFNFSRIAAQFTQLVLSKQELLRYLIIICATVQS